ncbi:MAG: A24 family peptidase [Chloroflexota bacterium]|nr:A24 family peptidase [Chloroflexota bacterium]
MTLAFGSDSVALLSVGLAVLGGIWGVVADRIATRWPEHDETEGFIAGRRVGWRTVVVVAFGAVGLGALPSRFLVDPRASAVLTSAGGLPDGLVLAIFVAYVVVLVLLMATDLDQRLLPDVLTLPMIPLALLFALSGQNPLVGQALLPAVVAAILVPAVLYLPSLLFGAGAFGLGDVKLLVTVGLMSGAYRAVAGTVAGVIVAGVVILLLLGTRRVGLKSYIPFGPFLILGALWAILLPD